MKFLITVLVMVLTISQCVLGEVKEPKVYAQGAVLIDFKTGRVLWQKNMNEELPMASTTKIMTAILALESGMLEDVTVASKRASSAPQVKMGIKEGGKHRLYDLLYPLMLMSANDAAIVIAEHIGGSVEGFAQMMNEKAKEIGALNTEFVTPNGLDEGNHHSTAYDMALIARYALNNDEFVEIINTPSITIPLKNNDEKSYTFNNKNRLLKEYEGAIGVKTGFTGKAGNCFVGAAQRNGMELISVVLASGWGNSGKERKWSDTKNILNYGFENYQISEVITEDVNTGNVPVTKSKEGFVNTKTAESGFACVTEEELNSLKTLVNLKKSVEAPVKKNDVLGTASVYTQSGELLFQTDIVSCENIERHDLNSCIKKTINLWLNCDFEFILN